MTWDLRQGMRVVCIDSAWNRFPDAPHKGIVYTILETQIMPVGTICVHPDQGFCETTREAVFLKLVERPSSWWESISFRPVDEAKIDQFRAHLAPKDKARKKADA